MVINYLLTGMTLQVLLMEEFRRSPVGRLFFTGFFIHPRWLFGISEPSTVFIRGVLRDNDRFMGIEGSHFPGNSRRY